MLTFSAQGIQSAATGSSNETVKNLRTPAIFSDAILSIIRAPARDVSGECFLDEDYLRDHDGVQEFSKYSLVPGSTPRRIMPAKLPNLRVAEEDDEGIRMDSTQARRGREKKL